MKLYYLDIFAKGEPIRMMLTHAKIPFEDCRITGEIQKTMKADGLLEYGQLPMLELEDGTRLSQSVPIYNYISTISGFNPEGPLNVYKGESINEAICVDFFWKLMPSAVFAPAGAKRDEMFVEVAKKYQEAAVHLDRVLGQKGDKFICGNKMTTHDFTVGGLWLNIFCNPNSKDTEFWAKQMEASPERVKKYVADLKEELKEYLVNREQYKCPI